MKNKHVYICQNHMDGIFTGIYDAWASRWGHENNRLLAGEPEAPELFCEYIQVEPDGEKARRVAVSIRKKISEEAFRLVGQSVLSKDPDKADAIYRFLILGFTMGREVVNYLSNPYVGHIFEIDRNVGFEICHYKQFLRFSELSGGVLFSQIRPLNDVLIPVAEHFADRLPEENWLIVDMDRKTAALHRAGQPWILTDGSDVDWSAAHNYTDKELFMQRLWQRFVDTISIEERVNEKLQLSMLPKRYREFMREMSSNTSKSKPGEGSL